MRCMIVNVTVRYMLQNHLIQTMKAVEGWQVSNDIIQFLFLGLIQLCAFLILDQRSNFRSVILTSGLRHSHRSSLGFDLSFVPLVVFWVFYILLTVTKDTIYR